MGELKSSKLKERMLDIGPLERERQSKDVESNSCFHNSENIEMSDSKLSSS